MVYKNIIFTNDFMEENNLFIFKDSRVQDTIQCACCQLGYI